MKLKVLLIAFFLPALLILTGKYTVAQVKKSGTVTLSGYVKDLNNSETLPGAIVTIKGTNVKVTANSYGFYSLTLVPGMYTVESRYIGYNTNETTIELNQDKTVDFNMVAASTFIKEVVISAGKTKKKI